MTIRVLLAAIAAGLVAAIMMWPLQHTKLTPLIVYAEQFEDGHSHDHGDGAAHGADHSAVEAGGNEKSQTKPNAAGKEPRTFAQGFNTLIANMVTGAGYGLLMVGISLAAGVPVRVSSGIVWGALGWLCVQLLPALGLPPELPGAPAGDLAGRQLWWVATVGLSIAGFWLAILTKSNALRALGFACLIAPHAYGAPQPADLTSAVPAYVAAQFSVATLATQLFFWMILGLALGYFMDRGANKSL
jgi:cobalt transporter subunit CbtA